MKKLFALVLSTAMVMSMAAVAFADEEINDGIQGLDPSAFVYSGDKNRLTQGVIEYGKAAYYPIFGFEKGDYDVGVQVTSDATDNALTNEIYRVDPTIPHLITDQDVVDGLKVKLDIEQGKELIAANGVSVVKKYVETMRVTNPKFGVANDPTKNDQFIPYEVNFGTASSPLTYEFDDQGSGYYYFVEIKTVAKETTTDDDLIATIELNKSKRGDDVVTSSTTLKLVDEAGNYVRDENGDVLDIHYTMDLDYQVKDLKGDLTTNVGYENSYVSANGEDTVYKVVNDIDGGDLEPETYYLLKYDYDEDVEFGFGATLGGQNEGTFTVDVSGQGKNLLYFDTTIDEAIASANPTAGKLFALNFNNVKFNRTGTFVYEGENFEYAYEVMADGTLVLLGEFDGEEVSFNTRVLGKYLFSDVELVAAPAAVEDVVPSVDAPIVDVTNPATGAAA